MTPYKAKIKRVSTSTLLSPLKGTVVFDVVNRQDIYVINSTTNAFAVTIMRHYVLFYERIVF